jgi:thiamine-phosphate pyrophosphorylase
MLQLPRLYPILDPACFPDASGMFAAAEELAAAGVTLLQYRNKSANARRMLDDARELRARLGATVRLVMNDRADVCIAAQYDGLHLGQDDLSVESARRIIGPSRRLGVSTHNPEQLAEADRTSADYLAIGPIFATSSKANPDPVVGIEGVCRAREYPRQRPIRHRCRRRRGGGDIRLVTGSRQISRRIFAGSELKLRHLQRVQ